ncbi:peptidase M16 [Clostridium polyendosporum]|uniref:Peptidase M16 n=1 Tax=Clostridium polyendosporum TaxID=69208 RepID=A0A919RYN1_9CLOT|nr:pitrilysin family protein [Clostridium polyendosporum]GIM28136.1 peptidase M16 [Clostridium polyendosporum]
MKKIILDNGVKVLYSFREGNLTSFCIGFEGGANSEIGFNLGVAHALEHMIFKGTKNRSEKKINEECDILFGFNNAMTNFPYVIYYGTCISGDFDKAFELYSDIILNPLLEEEGFKDEMEVIIQECREWKEDITQHCEDEVFFNGFNKKRIKNIIIGTEESLKRITIKELRDFYKKVYVPQNCVISVVTSKGFEEITDVINRYFGDFKGETFNEVIIPQERNEYGKFYGVVEGFKGAKLQYIFDITNLSPQEIEALRVFNMWFGEGVSSLLFNEVRTKNALAYEISSQIKNDKGIKVFSISCSCSKDNIDKSIYVIDYCIKSAREIKRYIKEEHIKHFINRLKLKRALDLERSIVMANRLTTYEIMYGNGFSVYDELELKESITIDQIENVLRKTLTNPTIQVLK